MAIGVYWSDKVLYIEEIINRAEAEMYEAKKQYYIDNFYENSPRKICYSDSDTYTGLLLKNIDIVSVSSELLHIILENLCRTLHPDCVKEFGDGFSLESLRAVLGTEKKEVFLDTRQKLRDGIYHWTSTQIIHVDNPYSDDKLAILISRRADEQRYEEEQQREALQSALDNANAASEAKGQFLSNSASQPPGCKAAADYCHDRQCVRGGCEGGIKGRYECPCGKTGGYGENAGNFIPLSGEE